MRKILLLSTVLSLSFSKLFSQAQTAFIETFDLPSGADSVTTGSVSGTAPILWNDTGLVWVSPSQSYHVSGSLNNPPQVVFFETDVFSTEGNPYISLSFDHIAKIFVQNEARVYVSVDSGATYTQLTKDQYNGQFLGGSPVFKTNDYFNETAYNIAGQVKPFRPLDWLGQGGIRSVPSNSANPSWWVRELFDLTGVASDTAKGLDSALGYPNVKIRFEAEFKGQAPVGGNPSATPPVPPTLQYLAGWFVDNVLVRRAPCELNPPSVSFKFPGNPAGRPAPCYANNPTGSIVAETSQSYPVGVVVYDTATVYESGVDSVFLYYSVNGGAFIKKLMPLVTASNPAHTPAALGHEYKTFINNLNLKDSVRYYVTAQDTGCPNLTRNPDTIAQSFRYYEFVVDSALPTKCGQNFCGQFPNVIKNFPWVEDFESPEWVAGVSGSSGNTGNAHRGSFPTFPDNYWIVSPNTSVGFGWSVRTGPTGTAMTGPDVDHTTNGPNGKYLYVEGSQGGTNPPGNQALLITPCISLVDAPQCMVMEFWYHMYGEDIDRLRVDIDTGTDTEAFFGKYFFIKDEQQTSSSDPWRKALIDLTPFVGQIIRIQFVGIKRNSGGEQDIAIDDLRIFEPDPIEIEVFETTYPRDGFCSYSSAENVEISIRNNACDTAVDIPIAFQVRNLTTNTNGPIQRDTIYNINLARAKDTLSYIFPNEKADLSVPAPNVEHDFQITVWTEMPGDAIRANDTLVGPVIHHYREITSYPYVEDFENGVVGTQNINNTDFFFDAGFAPNFRWTVGQDLTPTRNTGPYRGFYFEGKYLYAASNFTNGNQFTFLRSKCFDLSGLTNPRLDFVYHAFGANIDRLEIEVSKANEDIDTWNLIPGSTVLPGQQNEVRADWRLKRVDLSAYANTSIKLRFKVYRKGGGNATDFAIDNLTVYDALASDGGAFSIDEPKAIGSGRRENPAKFTIANYGNSTLTSVSASIRVTPLCGQGPPQTYTETFSVNIAPGTTGQVTLSDTSYILPVGESELCVWTNLTGDSYNFNDTICGTQLDWATFDCPSRMILTIVIFRKTVLPPPIPACCNGSWARLRAAGRSIPRSARPTLG